MKVILNPILDEGLVIDSWPVKGELSRVDIQHGDFIYSIILDNIPKVEIFNLDPNEEMGALVNTIELDPYEETKGFRLNLNKPI